MKHLKLYEEYTDNQIPLKHPGFLDDRDSIIKWLDDNTNIDEQYFKDLESYNAITINYGMLSIDFFKYYLNYRLENVSNYNKHGVFTGYERGHNRDYWIDVFADEYAYEVLFEEKSIIIDTIPKGYLEVDFKYIGGYFYIKTDNIFSYLGIPRECDDHICILGGAMATSIPKCMNTTTIIIDNYNEDECLILDTNNNDVYIITNDDVEDRYVDPYDNDEDRVLNLIKKINTGEYNQHQKDVIISNLSPNLYNLYHDDKFIKKYDIDDYITRVKNSETHKDIMNL